MLTRLVGRYPLLKLIVLFYAISWLVSIYQNDVTRPGLGTHLPPGARKFLAMAAVAAVARAMWLALDGRRTRGAEAPSRGERSPAGAQGSGPVPSAASRETSLRRIAVGAVGVLIVLHLVALLVQLFAVAGGFGDAWPVTS